MPDTVIPLAPAFVAPEPAPATATWFSSITDAEVLGHVQLKGWDKLDPAAAATAAAQAHRQAEKHIGVPTDQLMRMPKDAADVDGWNALYTKLGRPPTATEYDLSTVKVGEEALPENYQTFLQTTAHSLGLSKEGGVRLAADFVKFLDGVGTADAAEFEAKLTSEKAALATSWGQNFEGNMGIVRAFAEKAGVSAEAIVGLEKQVGYKAVMDMFLGLAAKSGEAPFHAPGAGGQPGQVLSYEMAIARKSELMDDSAWVTRYQAGGAPENREFAALMARIAAGR